MVTYIVGAVLVGAAALVIAWVVVSEHGDPERLAHIGDAIAPVAALLSTVALGAAVASVIMQSQELALQRSELRQAREAQQSLAEESRRANDLAERAAAAQERSNDLAEQARTQQERANALAEQARTDQAVANDVADLANAIALLRARLAVMTAGLSSIAHLAVAVVEGRDPGPLTPDQADIARILRGHILTADALHKLLRGGPPPGESGARH